MPVIKNKPLLQASTGTGKVYSVKPSLNGEGGGGSQDIVYGTLTPTSEQGIFDCSISNEDLYKIISEDKKIVILSFPDYEADGYCAVYGAFLDENAEYPYLFYVETITNYFLGGDAITWSNSYQKFIINGGD